MRQIIVMFLIMGFFMISCESQINKKGLPKKLTKIEKEDKSYDINNALKIHLNSESRIVIDNKEIDIDELRKRVSDYESKHTSKSVIVITSSRAADYGSYVTLQNAIIEEIEHLRQLLAQKKYKTDIKKLKKEQLLAIKRTYPLLITDGK